MTKTEMIVELAERTDLSKVDAEKVLKAFIETVEDTLAKGEKIQLTGFGTFEVIERAAREGRNPKTGESMSIPETKSPKFKPGKSLKDLVK